VLILYQTGRAEDTDISESFCSEAENLFESDRTRFGRTSTHQRTCWPKSSSCVTSVTYIEDEEADFDEAVIGFPDQVFHKESLEEEIRQFTSLVVQFFECNNNLQYVLCSYEMNGSFLGNVNRLQDFSDDLLKRFPIVYKRGEALTPILSVNLEAQDILAPVWYGGA
jgi:hypothetical protein